MHPELPSHLRAIVNDMPEEYREPFLTHLNGGTSARWLSHWLSLAGYNCSETTIKRYRRGYR